MTIYDMVMNGDIPPVIDHERIDTIIVHGCNFHADDVALVALIKECHNPDVNVIRTNDISEYEPGNGVLIADIGGDYDGEWLYDHHQIKWDSGNSDEARSSVGLFWDDHGNPIYHRLNPFIREIDKHDTGGRSQSQMCYAIADMNPPWDVRDPEMFMQNFYAAVDVMRIMIRARISSNLAVLRAEKYLDQCKVKNGILYVNRFVPWKDYMIRHNNIYAVISHGRNGGYNCQCVKGSFPVSWLHNKPLGISWVHANRFMCECADIHTAEYAASRIIGK